MRPSEPDKKESIFLRIRKEAYLKELDAGVENTELELFKSIFKDTIAQTLLEMDTVVDDQAENE